MNVFTGKKKLEFSNLEVFLFLLRKPTDNPDCDGETDLQGLVSNILDDADSQDHYYSERYGKV